MNSSYYIPAGSAAAPYTVDVTPESAGWTDPACRSSTSTTPGGEVTRDTTGIEVMIVPLAGGGSVEADGEIFDLAPRASVFDGPADMVYIGLDTTYTLRGNGSLSRSAVRARRIRCRTAASPPRMSRSNCAARATAAARCTTSVPPACSTPTR